MQKLYGTKSTPPVQNGEQRKILLTVKDNPLITPYLLNASLEYCEQVG